MVHKISMEKKHTDDCSVMSWGYNPLLTSQNPYHGAYLAVVESVSKLVAREASAEMGLISPGGQNLLDFLELRQVLSTYDGALRDPLWWPQERPVPMRVPRGPFGIPLPLMPGPRTLCELRAGT